MYLNFRSTFYDSLINHGCLHRAILKTLSGFEEARAQAIDVNYYFAIVVEGLKPFPEKWSFLLRISMVNMIKTAVSLRIWLHLLKKSLMQNFILCAVNVEQLHILKLVKVHCSNTACSSSWWPTIHKLLNTTADSVEKHWHCFVVLNVKLQVNIRFRTFYWLLELFFSHFALNSTTNTVCFAQNFAYHSSKCVFYGRELNI